MSAFKIGDRIRIKKGHCRGKAYVNFNGVIKDLYNSLDYDYAVEFDDKFAGGHDCQGRTKNWYGQWMEEKDLELLEFNDGLENWV